MIQDQSYQSQLPPSPLYEQQVQVINTSDHPICVSGLDNYMSNPNASQSIIIKNIQPHQLKERTKHLKTKIILITTPTTEVITPNSNNNNCMLLETNPNNLTKAYNLNRSRARRSFIQVPFLPSSPSTTPSVKIVQVKAPATIQQETHSSAIPSAHLTQTPTANILIDEDFNSCSETVSQFQVISSENIQSQPKQKTLASMAGIQLTGSVESLPAAMSGAMPTATVEEINVPVFINEYLQQATYLQPTSNGNDHSKSNKNILSQVSENDDLCIEDSIDYYIDSDIFDNFEFDIDMITTGENTNSESNFNIQKEAQAEEEEQQKEMMYYNDDENTEDFFEFPQNPNMFCDNTGIVSKIEIKYENPDGWSNLNGQNQLHNYLSPTDSQEMLLNDSLDIYDENSNLVNMQYSTEEAVDITPWTRGNDLPLSQIMNSSENNPMLSITAPIYSQNLLLNAEPIVPKIYDVIKMEETDCEYNYSRSESGAVKRMNTTTSGSSTVDEEDMREKRLKLRLKTPLCNNENNQDLSTPGIVDLIDQMGLDKKFEMPIKNTFDIIYSDLLNCSNSSFQSAQAEINAPFTAESYHDDDSDEPPSTPQSCISSSTYTNQTHTITSPNSPALSTISTTSRQKSRRGRPPKLHSDRPDPSQLRHLSESDRKRLEDRAKNNEASRVSRLKNKKREEEEIEKEHTLIEHNKALTQEYSKLCNMEEKLKRVLKRRLHV